MKRIIKNAVALVLCLVFVLSDSLPYVEAAEIIEENLSEEESDSGEELYIEDMSDYEAEGDFALASDEPSNDSATVAVGNCGVLDEEGKYGDNLVYELIKETKSSGTFYTLTISGTGEMGPKCNEIWKTLVSEFHVSTLKLNLCEGMTSIGDYAFSECNYFVTGTLDIPDSVTYIGVKAFYSCRFLTGDLIIPEYVETIATMAFSGCSGFNATQLNIPESVKKIGPEAFTGCNFPSFYLPETIEELGSPDKTPSYPFRPKIDNTPVVLYVIKDSYAYKWADENTQYGYQIELAQRKYRIYYHVCCEDGKVEPSIAVAYEERELGELTVPVRDGYSFLGWYDDEEAGNQISPSDICRGPVDAYAHWSVNFYELSFDKQGGLGSANPRTVVFDECYGELPEVTRENFNFLGWYTEPDAGTLITEDSKVKISKDHTLYAHWLGVPMTVSFDSLEGVGTADDKEVYFDSPYGALPVVSKPNCTFMGWFTQKNGGEQVEADARVDKLEDHTLYAHWEGVHMKVFFDIDGQTNILSAKDVMYGSTYGELPSTSRDDKDFAGWYTAKEGGTEVTEDTMVTKTSNHNLYAHWDHKHVYVSFDTNGGSSSHPKISVECEVPYGELPVPTRTGYVFDGWYNSKIGGLPVTAETTVEVTTSHTIYAHWKPKDGIKVSFDKGPGVGETNDIYVTFTDTYFNGGEFPIVTREDYTFAGWYTASNGGKRILPTSTVENAEDHTLYARWQGKPINVTFETGEIAGQSLTKTVYYDDFYGTMSTPVRYGLKFEGWYTEETGGDKIEPTTRVTVTNDQVLYAHWSNKVCAVSYELDGGENDSRNPVTYVKSNETIPLYDPRKLGYSFEGWYVGPSKVAKERITQISKGMAEDVTLYAKWKVNTYKIKYVMGVSATNPNSSKKTYRVPDHNREYSKYQFKSPAVKGYVFQGWFLDSAFTEPISYIDGTFEGDITLYAKWIGATYTIKYNAPEAPVGAETPTTHQYKNPNSTVSDGSGFIREGYYVDKWYLNSKLKGKFILPGSNANDILTDDGEIVNVYAHWKENTYFIAYDRNGGASGNIGTAKVKFGKTKSLSKCKFKKKGYYFDSWNTKPDGSGKAYKAKEVVSNLSTYNNDTVTLYAQWKPICYTIAFNPYKGTGSMESVKGYYDTVTVLPDNTFTRTGYQFKNWKSKSRVGGRYLEFEDGESGIFNVCEKNGKTFILKAQWEYDVSFDPNCSDYEGEMSTVTLNADKRCALPKNTYVRAGYKFMGWALTPTATKKKYSDEKKVKNLGNRTLYAVWKAN